jgi:hypothetical protein
MRNRFFLALPALLALVACGSSSNAPIDASADGAAPSDTAAAVDVHGNDGQDGADAVVVDAAEDQRDGGADGNTDAYAQADCAAIELLPPIVSVVDAVTGAPICDPMFNVDWPDGGTGGPRDGAPFACGQSMDDHCPGPLDDGGARPCAFALGIFYASNVNVEVSKPGYATASVQVSSGRGGCVSPVPASHVVVQLHPVADAAADGG